MIEMESLEFTFFESVMDLGSLYKLYCSKVENPLSFTLFKRAHVAWTDYKYNRDNASDNLVLTRNPGSNGYWNNLPGVVINYTAKL